MPLFQPLVVPRTKVCHQNPILLDGGRGQQEFFSPRGGAGYMGREVIPPDNKWSDGTPSFMAPIRHYHLLQSETFHVESGSGIWYMQGREITLQAGQDITIPRFVAHTFINASKTEPLVFSYRYDRQMYAMERKFFCNALTYLWDCKQAGVQPSMLQICVFTTQVWMTADFFPGIPGGDYVRCLINTLFMWAMALIGRLLFGYKSTYDEYYDEAWWMSEEKKKR